MSQPAFVQHHLMASASYLTALHFRLELAPLLVRKTDLTQPLQVSQLQVSQRAFFSTDTAHHAVSVSVLTIDALGDGPAPMGCERDGSNFTLDLGVIVDGCEPQREESQAATFDEDDDEQMQM